jgi:MoaA/NifB/PqqE/SkfB family radical SAM enzyme
MDNPRPVDPPRTLFLELTSHCNMHCAFCPSDVLRRPKGHLEDRQVHRFLDELHALGIRAPVLLNVLGEPLLNKKIYQYLDILEEAGHPVTLITNMSLLADKMVQCEILRHPNVTLALSLQTATERSYEMRGYPLLPFAKFFELAFDLTEEKFRMNSGTRLEIHIASTYVLAHDPSIQADGRIDPWPNFPSEKAERRFIDKTLKRLDRLALRIKKEYPRAFAAERVRAAAIYSEHIGKKIAVNRSQLPPHFERLKDEVFWGYMALPNVFLVFKSLELWTRDRAFLEAALPPGWFVYVEERVEPRPCLMADSFGLLANGDFVLCCLDYEGEMRLGNIDEVSVAEALSSEKRAAVRRDAMTEAVCRRCKGDLYVFDTSPLSSREQTIDKFGRGFWPYEPGIYGLGGRWTKGRAWAYVFVRIPARRIRLSYLSELEEDAPLKMTIHSYDAARDNFFAEASFAVRGREGVRSEFEAAFEFTPGRFYRIEIASPTFVPDAARRSGDLRKLGLAVFSICLLR